MIESVCENCKHWLRSIGTDNLGICHINAVDPDVGHEAKAVVYLSANATCLAYDDAFEPSDEYLAYLHEAETQNEGL